MTNIPFSGVHLRPEFLALLHHADVEPQHLITLDDLPDLSSINSKLPPRNTKWILVDHNNLQGTLGNIYSDRVGGVIDHHGDEHRVPQNTGSEPRIITEAGSCTSLVTDHCRKAWDMLSNSVMSSSAAQGLSGETLNGIAARKLWDAQIAQLGLASILIDTANLKWKEKTTNVDIKSVEYLEAKIMACPQVSNQFDRTKFFNEIDTAKKDIGGIKLQEILRKDYKQWTEGNQKLGISSVVKPISFLQEKARCEANERSTGDAFLIALQKFSEDRELGLFALMTQWTSSEGEFQRELFVWAFTVDSIAAVKKFLVTASDELRLEDWHDSDEFVYEEQSEKCWRKVWRQRGLEHSRKRVAHLLREAMR